MYRLILETPFTSKTTISYGLIVFAKDTKRWIVIQRKHSVEFLLLVKGTYRIVHLPFLLMNITSEEADILSKSIKSEDFFSDLFKNVLKFDDKAYTHARYKLYLNRELLSKLMKNADFGKNKLSWFCPKVV